MKRSLLAFAALTAFLGAIPSLAAVPIATGPNFQVNVEAQGAQRDVDVAQDTAGNTVFVWIDENPVSVSIQARVFDPAGNPLGSSFVVSSGSMPKRLLCSGVCFNTSALTAL